MTANSSFLEHSPSSHSIRTFSCGPHHPFWFHFLCKMSQCWEPSDLSTQPLCHKWRGCKLVSWIDKSLLSLWHLCFQPRWTLPACSVSFQMPLTLSIPSETTDLTSWSGWQTHSSPSLSPPWSYLLETGVGDPVTPPFLWSLASPSAKTDEPTYTTSLTSMTIISHLDSSPCFLTALPLPHLCSF